MAHHQLFYPPTPADPRPAHQHSRLPAALLAQQQQQQPGYYPSPVHSPATPSHLRFDDTDLHTQLLSHSSDMFLPLSPGPHVGSSELSLDGLRVSGMQGNSFASASPPSASGSGGGVGGIKGGPSKHPRLLSLDAFRGLVMAWMIFADEIGSAWTHGLDHAPWDGLYFADFVFPAFVFIVGLAVPLSTHKFALDRWGATRKALWRSIKMFAVGLLASSGGFPGHYVLVHMRIPGILQRIAFVYLLAVLIHVWVPVREPGARADRSVQGRDHQISFGRGAMHLYSKYMFQWMVALLFVGVYLALTFGTKVPGCGYGHLDPECNATGYWDRKILGTAHLYKQPTYQRSEECAANAPGHEPLPDRPQWCDRPFDPEGIVGTFTTCFSAFLGLFFGHVLSNETRHRSRLTQWGWLSATCVAAGLALHFSGAIPLNKNLWSLSYVLLMAGVDGIVFGIFYYVVDVKGYHRAVFPLMAMGMNAILVFVLAQTSISLDTFIRWVYIENPDENLYHWYRVSFLQHHLGLDWGIFLWCWTKLLAWLGISVLLYRMRIFWKL